MKPNQFIAVVCLLLALVLLAIDQRPDLVPVPRPTVLRAIIVEESADRQNNPDLAIILSSMEVRGLFEEFRPIDPDTPSDLQQYVDRATSLPTLFIVDPDDKIWYEGGVPLTVQEWRSLVAEIKGEK